MFQWFRVQLGKMREQIPRSPGSPNRICVPVDVFSGFSPRHRLADLFLDTFNYNAHTTASDALWVGLPVLSKIGEGFAARVAGSLLNAIDLPELITTTEEAYENLALDLATNPPKLQAIKQKLLANRDTKPLFDTALFTQHLEEAYRKIYDLYYEGGKAFTHFR